MAGGHCHLCRNWWLEVALGDSYLDRDAGAGVRDCDGDYGKTRPAEDSFQAFPGWRPQYRSSRRLEFPLQTSWKSAWATANAPWIGVGELDSTVRPAFVGPVAVAVSLQVEPISEMEKSAC